MNRQHLALLASFALVAAAHDSLAAADASPKAAIDRAIAVHGGASTLRALPVLERTGTVESLAGRGAGRRTDLVLREREDGAYRREATFEFRGRKSTSIEFYDGTIVKRRFGSSWDDLPVDEAREGADHRLSFLVTLDAAGAKAEGEGSEADVPCVMISVPDGTARATLWFAKDDGRLVAMDYPGTSAEGMGTKKQVRRKVVFRDHRKVGALLLPFDVEYSEDGTPDARYRFESTKVLLAFDAGWVKLPDPTRRFIPPEELTN